MEGSSGASAATADSVPEFKFCTSTGGGPLVVSHITYAAGRGNIIVEYLGTVLGRILSFVGCHMDVVTADPADWVRLPSPMSIVEFSLKPATTHFPPISPHGSNTPTNKTLLSHLLNNNQLDQAHRLFAQIPSLDAHLYTMMITAFSRTNHLNDAFHLFNTMPNRDIPSWNTMIKGCLSCGDLNTATNLFDGMPDRNIISWTTMISGLANAGNINTAENPFYQMPHRDTAVCNSMIFGYCSSGRVLVARDLFDRKPQRNVISWTTMIGGYDQNGESDQALVLFRRMCGSGVEPTSTTFACVITACTNVADLTLGTQLYTHVRKIGYLFDTMFQPRSSCVR